jgi:RHS repeat-associated protein
MNKLTLYLITLLGLCLTQPMAHAMSVQWTDYGYDNNGNVTELYDGDSGEIVGQYEYDPYGNTIKAEGQAARENKIRFSTKEYDSSTGLYYYGYRHYDPKTGRWPSRDPIEERGGVNLYGMVANNAVNKSDYLGLEEQTTSMGIGAAIGGAAVTANVTVEYDCGLVPKKVDGFANFPPFSNSPFVWTEVGGYRISNAKVVKGKCDAKTCKRTDEFSWTAHARHRACLGVKVGVGIIPACGAWKPVVKDDTATKECACKP